MKQTQVIIIAIVALVIGFAGGFVLRPVLVLVPAPIATGSAARPTGIAQPSEAEATAAVRRFRAGFQTYSQATLTLGECSAVSGQPGATCMTNVVLRPGSAPQNRMIGFARVDGQWEVSVMQ